MPASDTTYWVVYVAGCTEPELCGPFATEVERDQEARDLYEEEGGDENFFGRLNVVNGVPEIGSYTTAELEPDEDPDHAEE